MFPESGLKTWTSLRGHYSLYCGWRQPTPGSWVMRTCAGQKTQRSLSHVSIYPSPVPRVVVGELTATLGPRLAPTSALHGGTRETAGSFLPTSCSRSQKGLVQRLPSPERCLFSPSKVRGLRSPAFGRSKAHGRHEIWVGGRAAPSGQPRQAGATRGSLCLQPSRVSLSKSSENITPGSLTFLQILIYTEE